MTPAITDTISWWAPFEALEVGQEFTTRGRTVTEADVVGFASLTGDWHPQHADAHWCESSPFGERIAHGLLIVSLAAGLVPFDPGRVVALRQVSQATFKRPVRFGDTVHVQGRIAELAAGSEDAGLVTFAWNVVNQDERVVCRARVDVLWRRDGELETDSETVRNGEFVPIPL
jgi:3-hydroxybutyryl-CoA dehydratase